MADTTEEVQDANVWDDGPDTLIVSFRVNGETYLHRLSKSVAEGLRDQLHLLLK
jgi:hypothetical protein